MQAMSRKVVRTGFFRVEVLAIFAVLVLPLAKAEVAYLTTSDGSNQSAFLEAWKDHWTPNYCPAVSTGVDYAVTNVSSSPGGILRTPKSATSESDYIFNGQSLTLGCDNWKGAQIQQYGPLAYYANRGLFLFCGSYRQTCGKNTEAKVGGKITITAPVHNKEYAVSWHGRFTNSIWTVTADWYGEDGAGMRITTDAPGYRVNIDGSLANCRSEFVVKSYEDYDTTISIGSNSFPGKLTFEGVNTKLELKDPTTELALSQLSAAGGTTIEFPVDKDTGDVASLTVGSTCSISGKVRFILTGLPSVATQRTIMTAPKGSLNEANIDFEFRGLTYDPREVYPSLIAVEHGEDIDSILVSFPGAVWQTESDSKQVSSTVAYSSAITNDAQWSDGHAPRTGHHYIVPRAIECLRVLGSTTESYEFPGESLLVEGGNKIYLLCKSQTIGSLFVNAGCEVWQLWNADSQFNGKMTVFSQGPDDYVTYVYYSNQKLGTINAELIGDGNLVFKGYSGSSNPCGYVKLTGVNTNFTGTMCVTCDDKMSGSVLVAPTLEKYQKLQLTDKFNLGGPLSNGDLKARALTIEKMSVVEPLKSMVLDDVTRGITVRGVGRIRVPKDVDFRVKEDLTLAGVLRKEGAGLMWLGGVLAVAADDAGVLVSEGGLGVLSAAAVKGVPLTFGTGTVLAFPAIAEDASLTSAGIDLTADGAMIEYDTDGLHVQIDDSMLAADQRAVVTLFKMRDVSSAKELMKDIRVGKTANGRKVVLTIEELESGFAIIRAEVSRHGLVLMVY